MPHSPKINPKNEFDVLMNLGFEMDVPEGDSVNYADSNANDDKDEDDIAIAEEIVVDESEVPLEPVNYDDPTQPVPGESEWSQKNRLPVQEQEEEEEEEIPKEDLFALLHDQLLYHPLAHQLKLDRYVRRLKLITF